MKPSICRIASLVGVALFATTAFAEKIEDRVARSIIVRFKSQQAAAAFDAKLPNGYFVNRDIPRLNIQGISAPNAQAADSLLNALKSDNTVKYVEKDIVMKTSAFPNDPMYLRQFSHTKTLATAAWGITQGNAGITVAILDTGVNLSHPEFAGRIVNPMSFVAAEPTAEDGNGHGTHCSGIASAKGNNSVGVAGVSWNSMIMPVKVLSQFGSGSFTDVIAGITGAADAGANVISMSLGGFSFGVPQALADAVDYAMGLNVIVVAASGNNGLNLDTFFLTNVPGGYPPVYSVASSNNQNRMSYFSNYGQTVDVVAPGEGILSTLPGGYGIESGTSMACPYIAGTCALIYATGGTSMTPQQVQDAINNTAAVGPAGCAHGLVNVFRALREIPYDTNFDATPASVNIIYGSLSSGSGSDITVLDGTSMGVASAVVPAYGPVVMYDATYNLGDISNVRSMLLRHYVSADVQTNSTLNLWDPTKLKWVTFGSNLVGTNWVTMSTWLFRPDLDKYVDGNGVLKVRYTGVGRVRRFGDGGTGNSVVSTDAQGLKFFLK